MLILDSTCVGYIALLVSTIRLMRETKTRVTVLFCSISEQMGRDPFLF